MRKYITACEWSRIFEAISGGINAVRDRAMFHLAYRHGLRVKTQGKNRDVPGRTRLPCSDIHTALALYRSVAAWALLEGRPVTVPDIADAFCLSLRQAGDIMQFLLGEAGEVFQTEKRVVSRPRRNALLEYDYTVVTLNKEHHQDGTLSLQKI
ncbi:hypothetical protein ACS41U_20320 [Salmonella enterica]|uniref:hypothetical protein n=1 Tax=Salmonella enterica TaxID=28901 RepID=UPI00199768B2|nr:hypothetical protein [Salmonella enterica]MDL2989067.1 hypothetical protein [Salmonella enterica]HAK6771626.1 hypothetical protein [Salmonella enterica]